MDSIITIAGGALAALILFVVGALLLAFIGVFNRLIRARNRARSAWSSIDVHLKKRHELIPNLVETVKGYAEHEQTLLTGVTELRARAVAETAGAGNAADIGRTEAQIATGLGRVVGLAEAYPELRADKHFDQLSRTLTEIEEQISAARRAYNAAVFELNNLVQQFPTSIVASVASFRAEQFFQAD